MRCILGIFLSYNSVWPLMCDLLALRVCCMFEPSRRVFSPPISIKMAFFFFLTWASAAYARFYFWSSFEMHHFKWAPVYFLSRPCENSCGSTWVSRLTSTARRRRRALWTACGGTVSSCREVTPVWPAPETPTITYF